MDISTLENSVSTEVARSNEDMREEIISALAEIDKKILAGHLSKSDVHDIASKMNRDIYTVRKYVRGDVRNLDVALRILKMCNAYLAINYNAAEQKNRVTF